MNEKADMERAVLEQYARLTEAIGGKAPALEIVCGAFLCGDIRGCFLENVFGREIRATAEYLERTHGGDSWRRLYRSLSEGDEYVHGAARGLAE